MERERVAWITGASSGIGRGLAKELHAAGYRLALSARRAGVLEQVAAELGAAAFPLDVTRTDDVYATADAIVARFGRLDLAIAAAGVRSPMKRADQVERTELEHHFAVNLLGAVHTLQASTPAMVKQRAGHLVGISSLAAFRALPQSAVYCASKAGLSTYLEAMRLDLKHQGIHVSCVSPGFVKTPILDGYDGPTPFMWDVDRAVRRIRKGIARRELHIVFPWQMAMVMRWVRSLPAALHLRLGALR